MALTLCTCYFLLTGCATLSTVQVDANSPQQAKKLAQAIPKYQKLRHLAWQAINPDSELKPGHASPIVPTIKQRLIALNDNPTHCLQPDNPNYTPCLQEAIKTFQLRHSLKADGVLGHDTIQALNITPAQRIAALHQGINQWQQLPKRQNQPYLNINIPSFELQAIRNNQAELQMPVIVGRPDWPTPTLTSKIQTVVLNPNWNVPVNITEKELIQKIVDNPNYLEEHNIYIKESWKKDAKEINPSMINWQDYLGDKTLPFRLTQAPGEENALGKIKFIFPNKEHIYLHDTPKKGLFSLSQRAMSHGCIRLSQPMALLEYLAKDNENLNPEKTTPYLTGQQTKYLALNQPLPLYITYITTWVDNQGRVHFSPDIYQKPQKQPSAKEANTKLSYLGQLLLDDNSQAHWVTPLALA